MKQKTLKFASPIDVTPGGLDGTVIRFPFAMVDTNLLGAPEESRKTSHHNLDVTIARTRRTAWESKLGYTDLIKILFEIGTREVKERLRQRDLTECEKVDVTTRTHSSDYPFDPVRIENPEGAVIKLEIDERIGFI